MKREFWIRLLTTFLAYWACTNMIVIKYWITKFKEFDLSWFMMVPDCCMFSSVHEALQGSNGEQLLVISSSTKVSRNWCWCGLLGKSCLILLLPHGLYPPSSSVHGISQIRILDRVVISFYRASSPLRDQTHVSCTGKHILYHWAAREAH